MNLFDLTASDAVRAMRKGSLSPVEYLQGLLDRIRATEDSVKAWDTLNIEGAQKVARRLERERRDRSADILYGLPVGLKDVFHVRGLSTKANFEPYHGQIAKDDSGVAQDLRAAGAIIMGKTVTVQFASGPGSPKTRNPWDTSLSPGGSSSGSGAAVGARQVPAAIGTQTAGSTLRPAAFCGVVGFKPTFGRISRRGLLPVSWSLDHAGLMARSVADVALLLQALARHDSCDPYSAMQAPEDFVAVANQPRRPSPRLGLVLDLVERAEPEVQNATFAAIQQLEDAGAEIREVRLPFSLDLLVSVHYLIYVPEQAAVQSEQHARLASYYYSKLRADIEVGQLIPACACIHARRLQRRLRGRIEILFDDLDGLIAPTAPALPKDPVFGTGDPTLLKVGTLFGFPIISLPTTLNAVQLPHAVQIIGRSFCDADLLGVAAWCESVFGPMRAPF